jgi:hypothetical protein
MKRGCPIRDFICDEYLLQFLISYVTVDPNKVLSKVDKYLFRTEVVQQLAELLMCKGI